jgi:hypothetical protein
LETADVLLHGTKFPGDCQSVLEKRSWNRGAEDGSQAGHEGSQRIEYGHHLRRVTIAMSRNRTPN